MGRILGHKDIETTMTYTHQTQGHLKRSIEGSEESSVPPLRFLGILVSYLSSLRSVKHSYVLYFYFNMFILRNMISNRFAVITNMSEGESGVWQMELK